jgi:hypothetical protein
VLSAVKSFIQFARGHEGDVRGQLEQEFVIAFEIGGKEIPLVVVHVAIIAIGPDSEVRAGTAGAGDIADQGAALVLQALAEAEGNR